MDCAMQFIFIYFAHFLFVNLNGRRLQLFFVWFCFFCFCCCRVSKWTHSQNVSLVHTMHVVQIHKMLSTILIWIKRILWVRSRCVCVWYILNWPFIQYCFRMQFVYDSISRKEYTMRVGITNKYETVARQCHCYLQ